MTRSASALALALSAAAIGPALAQDQNRQEQRGEIRDRGQQQGSGQNEQPRTLTRTDDQGATSTLSAKMQGQSWSVELTRTVPPKNGNASEERTVLVFPSSAQVDKGLEQLFANPPQDPKAWQDSIEDLAHVDVNFDFEGPNWYGAGFESVRDIPTALRERMRKALDEFDFMLRQSEQGRSGRIGANERERCEGGCGDHKRGHGRHGRQVARDKDRVFLMNGDVVSGEILELTPEQVRLRGDTGEISYQREQIRRIDLKEKQGQCQQGQCHQGQATQQPGQAGPEGQAGQGQLGPARLGVLLSGDGQARIEEIKAGSAAERAGLARGDVITEFDGQAVQNGRKLRELIAEKTPGQTVLLSVRRGQQTLQLQTKLADENGLVPDPTTPIAPPILPEPPGMYR